jgi:gliding motility-associated-like protein
VNGCIGRDSIAVSYINPVSFNIGSDTTYCGSFTRIISAGVAHTIWSTGDTATYITVSMPGTYWATAFACGDTLTDTITISEKPIPLVNLGDDTFLCPSQDLILNAGNTGGSYQWQNNSTGQTLITTSGGLYWVNVTVNGCTGSDSILISDLPVPLPFTLGSDTTICDDSSIVFNAYQSGSAYLWSTGDTTSSIIVNQSGQYVVIDSNTCGSYTASVIVTTKPCVCRVAIPTAFSPNKDGKNDFYYVLTQCPLENFKFDIYNRWGQLIFSANNMMDKWDGTYKGQQQPIGVYVYFFKYTDPYTNREATQTGNVTLLR